MKFSQDQIKRAVEKNFDAWVAKQPPLDTDAMREEFQRRVGQLEAQEQSDQKRRKSQPAPAWPWVTGLAAACIVVGVFWFTYSTPKQQKSAGGQSRVQVFMFAQTRGAETGDPSTNFLTALVRRDTLRVGFGRDRIVLTLADGRQWSGLVTNSASTNGWDEAGARFGFLISTNAEGRQVDANGEIWARVQKDPALLSSADSVEIDLRVTSETNEVILSGDLSRR